MRDRVAISENCDPCKCNMRARIRVPSFSICLSATALSLSNSILLIFLSHLQQEHACSYNGRCRCRSNSLDSWSRTFGVITPLFKKKTYPLSRLFPRYREMFFSTRFPQKSVEIEERGSETKYFIRRCNCFRREYNSTNKKKKKGKKNTRGRGKKIYIVTAHSSPMTGERVFLARVFDTRDRPRRLWHGAHRRLISWYCRLIELRAPVIILFTDRATSLFPETFRRVLHFRYIAVRACLYRDISRVRTFLLY